MSLGYKTGEEVLRTPYGVLIASIGIQQRKASTRRREVAMSHHHPAIRFPHTHSPPPSLFASQSTPYISPSTKGASIAINPNGLLILSQFADPPILSLRPPWPPNARAGPDSPWGPSRCVLSGMFPFTRFHHALSRPYQIWRKQ